MVATRVWQKNAHVDCHTYHDRPKKIVILGGFSRGLYCYILVTFLNCYNFVTYAEQSKEETMQQGAGNNAQLIAFIDRLKGCNSRDEAWGILDQELKNNGIDNALYGFATKNANNIEEELLFHSHRDDFFEGYGAEGVKGDWATVHCSQHISSILWNTTELRSTLSPEQIEIENYAFDFNIPESETSFSKRPLLRDFE
jgi:hypothetical protein